MRVMVIRNASTKSISTHCDKWNFPWINQRNSSLKCCSRKNSLHFPGCDLVNYVPDQLLLLLFKTNTGVSFVDFCLISCYLHIFNWSKWNLDGFFGLRFHLWYGMDVVYHRVFLNPSMWGAIYLLTYFIKERIFPQNFHYRVPNKTNRKLILFWKFFPPTLFFSPNEQKNVPPTFSFFI